MREDLLYYYERELSYMRRLGAEFAEKYPKIAARLVLERDKCEDPHVERMLEGFAFLAARLHLRLDDDFPEITEGLLSVVYPHYLRPIPSMSVVEFQMDPDQGKLSTGVRVDRHAMLYSRPVQGTPCKFRTCYETTLWPLTVAAAEWKTPDRLQPALRTDAVGVVRLELRCLPDVTFDKLELDRLRFYLNGESNLVYTLYELLSSRCHEIVLRDPAPNSRRKPIVLGPEALRPVGFAEQEAMLPYPRRSFAGYRLLQEYFSFPEKFLFLDLTGLEALAAGGFSERAEVLILLSDFERHDRREILETGVSPRTFRLGCTPVINLFQQTAEPILLTQTKYEYPIVPDARRQQYMEVFSVDEVTSAATQTSELVQYEPFYSYRHTDVHRTQQTFWSARRRVATWRQDDGSDVYLTLVDLSGRPVQPNVEAITARLTCSNRDLPSRLPFGSESGDFELENGGPIRIVTALIKPTESLPPPLGRGLLWRLISQLSLNYLSLVDEGRDALQEILRLHNFSDSVFAERRIQGIAAVQSEPHFARVLSDNGISFARGRRVRVEFDEEHYVGGGVYLFASVLERFLGQYVSLNSFSQLVAATRQRKEVLQEWPPRAGQKILM